MDWYRRNTWTKFDEEEFFAKLSRAKKGSKEQYLKIQAIELVKTKEVKLLDVAESLLKKLLTEYPEDIFNKSAALHALGDICRQRQNIEIAIDYYKQAIEFEHKFPNVKTNAYIDYAEVVIKFRKIDLYNSIEKLIEERIPLLEFPLEKYKAFSILSIINYYHANIAIALKYAQLAEQNANAETSGFRYHKYLGIVMEKDRWLDELIKKNNTESNS